MTNLCFYIENGVYRGFAFRGHSGFGKAGGDIVCAGVSALARLAECVASDILGLAPETRVDENAPAISMVLPGDMPGDKAFAAESLLKGMHMLASELSEEFKGHISVRVSGLPGASAERGDRA